MRPAERGFLLLSSFLGNPERRPLTVSQLRILASRVQGSSFSEQDRELTPADLMALGYGEEMALRIVRLLEEKELLEHYLRRGEKARCTPMSRVSTAYPDAVREKLGWESPGCLWAKGDISVLDAPKISLVGSRDIYPENRDFAWEVGSQAAKQGFTLVSGNARGADRVAQTACLENGGKVICVVADTLTDKPSDDRILYISEEGFDQPFTAQRAISRNRVIHCLGEKTFVVQCGLRSGGTWDGTVKNLRSLWSPVFCLDDGSAAAVELRQMGAKLITVNDLHDIRALQEEMLNFFDR